MLLRRNPALALGALVLTVPALSSCGFDLATDRVTNYSNAANERGGTVDVVGAVIVAERDGSGTFLATLSNSPDADTISFDSLEGSGDVPVEAGTFEPYEVIEGGLVALSQEGGVRVTGEFEIGDFVPLSVGFDNGETVELSVPVHPACDEYEGLDNAPEAGGSAAAGEPYECELVEHETGH